jgi:PEP-CTERM motif
MRTGRFSVWSVFTVLGLLASLACGTRAHANDLNLGGNFNSTPFYTFNGGIPGGGGPIWPSTLNSVALPYVYCIDIPDNVYVPVDYKHSTVTNNGYAIVGSGNPQYNGGGLALTPSAGVIAWLLTNYANTASTYIQQDALQAAIWTAIYGYNTPGYALVVTDSAVFQQMQTDLGNNPTSSTVTLKNAGTAPVSNFYWLSPGDGSSTSYQALVTANVGGATLTTPEPSTFAIAGLGAMAFVAYGLRRRKAKGP